MRRSPWRGSTSSPRPSRGCRSAATTWPAASPRSSGRHGSRSSAIVPCLIIDGAHNGASAEALADTLRTCFPAVRRTLVFGTTREKDLRGQLQALLPLFDEVIATRYVENPRSLSPETVVSAVLMLSGRSAQIALDPAEALELARSLTAPDGLICVTGSLFLSAETRAVLLHHPETPIVGGVVR